MIDLFFVEVPWPRQHFHLDQRKAAAAASAATLAADKLFSDLVHAVGTLLGISKRAGVFVAGI